jgi:hypothetical protein
LRGSAGALKFLSTLNSQLPTGLDVSPAARDQVVQSLGEHFASDRITLDEYERRVHEALRAPSHAALVELTRDLGGPVVPVAAPLPATATVTRSVDMHMRRIAKPRRFWAFMSGVIRRGRWRVPERMRAIAIMGGVELDLSEAELTAQVTEIDVIAVMGSVVVTVPPGVRLESDGIAILGGFEDQLREPASGDPNAPIVRVRGVAIMGGVETKVVES